MSKYKFSMKFFAVVFGVLCCLLASSCNADDNEPSDYTEWRDRNLAYVDQVAALRNADGSAQFEKIIPDFASGTFVLIKWHNDRTLTAGNLSPMDNSTVEVAYELTDIDGKRLDGNASARFVPDGTVVGFCTALTNMKVGDTVTAVVPSSAGYGDSYHGTVKPYSTLVFTITLNQIIGYEVKH